MVKLSAYIRNQFVSEYAKRLENGICQLCVRKAPFYDNNGNLFLETHHEAALAVRSILDWKK